TYTLCRAMAASTTVRVSRETHQRLTRLATGLGVTTAELLAGLAQRAEEDMLLDQMNSHSRTLRADPQALNDHLHEREAWEATLLDGLERGA
ncbi:MAG: hypothetical protein ACREX8_20400, partial [Gammaproteobacteria bacterium]